MGIATFRRSLKGAMPRLRSMVREPYHEGAGGLGGVRALVVALAGCFCAPAVAAGPGLDASLTGTPGDAARGRQIIVDRRRGLCLLCHSGPFAEVRFQGTLAPSLAGAGARLGVADLRLRMVDSRKVVPDSIMPAYFRTEGLLRVAAAQAGKTLLDAQEIEDVVAFLATLKE